MPPETETPPGKIIARVAAGVMLTISAGNSSASLDKFASWFLAAFGAGLALIVSHLKDVSEFIPLTTVASASYFFLVAAVICVVQRYVATVVSSGAASAREGREIEDKFQQMDIGEFIEQMLKGVPWPIRWICKGQFDVLIGGDYAASGRVFMRLTLIQGSLVTIELVALLMALTKIVNDIKA